MVEPSRQAIAVQTFQIYSRSSVQFVKISTLPVFETSKNKGNSQIRSRFVAEKHTVLWVFMGFHGGLVQF
jgi:hypothetical protein